jgi:hypothetical protein
VSFTLQRIPHRYLQKILDVIGIHFRLAQMIPYGCQLFIAEFPAAIDFHKSLFRTILTTVKVAENRLRVVCARLNSPGL